MMQRTSHQIQARAKLLLVICSAFMASPAVSIDSFTLGTMAYEDGLYKEAATHWVKVAEDGHGTAQFNLGVLYEHGNGVAQNIDEALRWYTLAAKNGVTDAQVYLANLLFAGVGSFASEIDEAIYWYVQAADAGHAEAQFRLGKLFIEGESVAVDVATATSWLEIAAANHHLEAASLLRRLADQHTDSVRGHEWLRAQDPNQYTVRLYSAPTLLDAREFILALGLEGAVAYSTAPDRHHVAAGMFISERDAKVALSELPVALRARRPEVVQLAQLVAVLVDDAPIDGEPSPVHLATRVAPTPDNAQSPPPLPTPSIHGEEWLRARLPTQFTAMLFSANSEGDAIRFIENSGLNGAAVYKTKTGKFRVLGGLFNDLEEAKQSIAELGSQQLRLASWPISFADVVDDMESR